LAPSVQEKQQIEQEIKNNDTKFLESLVRYKKISYFPLQVSILDSRGLSHMISDEEMLLQQAHSEWAAYQKERDLTLVLSNDGKKQEALTQWIGPANEKLGELRSTYGKIIKLNEDLASIMYQESQSIVQRAFVYGIVASTASAAAALTLAIFFSRRLTPSLHQREKKARAEIEKFISSSFENKNPSPITKDSTSASIAVSNKLSAASLALSKIKSSDTKEEEIVGLLGQIAVVNYPGYQQRNNSDSGAKLINSLIQQTDRKSKVVVMTRKSSNLYHKAVNAGATIYILSTITQNPIATSKDGSLVISVSQTSLIIEAVRRTLQEDTSITLIIDNATELVHRLWFEKAFLLLQNISDVISPYEQSRVIILINKGSHDPNIVEAIANLANTFIE
jgi:uncharacterized protein GlcG (DUF336 family)